MGQALSFPRMIPVGTIHSHSCGTNKVRPIFGVVEPDSLPLAWDKLKLHDQFLNKYRFTPTRVGPSFTVRTLISKVQFHSHACGTNQSLNRFHASGSFHVRWMKRSYIFCSYNLEATCNSTQHHHTQEFFSQKLYISVSPLSIIDS